jgi:hypothetical protein
MCHKYITSGGAREQIIGVHSGAKTAKKPFLGVAHMVKNCSYTKKTKITRGPVHPWVNLDLTEGKNWNSFFSAAAEAS